MIFTKKTILLLVFLAAISVYCTEVTELIWWDAGDTGDPAQTALLSKLQQEIDVAPDDDTTSSVFSFLIPGKKKQLKLQHDLHKMFADSGINESEQMQVCRLILEDYLLKYVAAEPDYLVCIPGIAPQNMARILPREGFSAGDVSDRTVYEIYFKSIHQESPECWVVEIYGHLHIKNWSIRGDNAHQYRIVKKNPALKKRKIKKQYTDAMASDVRELSRNSLCNQFEHYSLSIKDRNEIIELIFADLMPRHDYFNKKETTIEVLGVPHDETIQIKLPSKVSWPAPGQKADRTLWFDNLRPDIKDEERWTILFHADLRKTEDRNISEDNRFPKDMPGYGCPTEPRWQEVSYLYRLRKTEGRWEIVISGSSGTNPYVILEYSGIGFTDRLEIVDVLLNDFLPRFFPSSTSGKVKFKGISREELELVQLPETFRPARNYEMENYRVDIRDMMKGDDDNLYIHLVGKLQPGASRYIVYHVRKEADGWKLINARLLRRFSFF